MAKRWPSLPTANAADVARRLKEEAIGAAVVQDGDGRIVGILSERDIVHALVNLDADLPRAPRPLRFPTCPRAALRIPRLGNID